MPILRAKPGIWCDYCKTRFPKGTIMHEKAASWTVISEHPDRKGMQRHYCQSCSEEVTKWNGEVWELQDQVDYAQKHERLNFNGI